MCQIQLVSSVQLRCSPLKFVLVERWFDLSVVYLPRGTSRFHNKGFEHIIMMSSQALIVRLAK